MTSQDQLSRDQITTITAYVDTAALPPQTPGALFLFGTNQVAPAAIAAQRYHMGLAPLIIATGGVNRHNGIIEGREFQRLLIERGVPKDAIRYEDQSTDTWLNVEYAQPYIAEALSSGLPITAICKWYHLRAIHTLKPRSQTSNRSTQSPGTRSTKAGRSPGPVGPTFPAGDVGSFGSTRRCCAG